MITAFTVKNFKAIGEEPVRIELKPITLLFGANSAGKSSILHALHYAYEIFNNRNLNPEKSTLGGNSLDLGGFERFVYNNDLNRSISIRLEFDIIDIVDYVTSYPHSVFIDHTNKNQFIQDLFNEITCYVEIDIAWTKINKKPYIRCYETGFNNEKIATVRFDVNKKQAILQYLNIDHPIFHELWVDKGISVGSLIKKSIDSSCYKKSDPTQASNKISDIEISEIIEKKIRSLIKRGAFFPLLNGEEIDDKFIENVRKKLLKKCEMASPYTTILASGEDNLNIILRRQPDALPYWDQPLSIDSQNKFFYYEDPYEESKLELNAEQRKLQHASEIRLLESLDNGPILDDLLTCVLVLPGWHISELFSMRYLGPLREVPPRHFSCNNPHDQSNRGRWATGLGAWDLLYWIGQQQLDSSEQPIELNVKEVAIEQLDIINDWLANKKRLNTGYRIITERYRELPSTHPLLVVLAADQSLSNIPDLVNNIICLPEKIRIWLQDEFGNKLTPHEIGVGISQILPVVVAAAGKHWHSIFVVIEQPELHIHPAMQVQLADLFISQASTKKSGLKNLLSSRSFLIETHSEHLLLRLLRRINETFEGELPHDMKSCTANDVAIYYLDKGAKGMHVRRLEISEDGNSHGDWPEGFFEERRAELF